MFASEEELYSLHNDSDTDCPYCRTAVPLTQTHLLKRHYRYAVFYREANTGNSLKGLMYGSSH